MRRVEKNFSTVRRIEKERDQLLLDEKNFASRQAKDNKKFDRLEQMERKKQSLEEKLEKIRRVREQPADEDVREEEFTLKKTKDQRDIEEEMERLIEEHKNDQPNQSEETSHESQSTEDDAARLEELLPNQFDNQASESWADLDNQQDLDEEMNSSKLGTEPQLQEVPSVDSEDIFAKYSHVLQRNIGSEDFEEFISSSRSC